MVKISVLVPVYNVGQYLEESMSSILNQTFNDFEVICVNDGSEDNSLEILNSFVNKDSRIKIIDKENGGCGSARNRALEEASGDFIYFFDPDDYILPNTFKDLYDNITCNNSDLVLFKIARFKDGEPVNYDKPLFDLDNIFKNVDFNNFTFNYKDIKYYVLNSGFAPWSKLYRKEFLDRYDDFKFDVGVAFDDVPFHVKSLLRAHKISFASDFYYFYRFDNPNSVNNTASNGIDIIRIVDIVEQFLKNECYFDDFKKEFYDFKANQIIFYLSKSNDEEYYQLAKKKLLELDKSYLHDSSKSLLKKYDCIVNSNSFKEYELNFKLYELKIQINSLSKLNKSFRKDINKYKKLNHELISSKSWKVTKPLRKIANSIKKNLWIL